MANKKNEKIMKTAVFLALVFCSLSISAQTYEQHKKQKSDNNSLEFLRKYNGKYPDDVKLLDNSKLKIRLVQLIGNKRYQYMKKIWAVEEPVLVNGNTFKASGCQAHNCDMTNFIIIVDLKKDKLYVGYKVEDNVEKFGNDKIYPLEIFNWESK